MHLPKLQLTKHLLVLVFIANGFCTIGQESGSSGKVSSEGVLKSGPIVGHTTDHSAKIWTYAPNASSIQIKYHPKNSSEDAKTVDVAFKPGAYNPAIAELTGLLTDQLYEYEVIVDGKPAAISSFKTAPEPHKPVQFRYVVGSCVRIQRHPDQPVWDEVIDLEPDLMVFGGDNVYADTTDRVGLWKRHLQQRGVENYAKALSSIPVRAIWDDHDYGPNNSDRTAAGKENSLQAFKEVWANPSYGTDNIPGIFHTFHWGDVQFFMMDNRYNKGGGDYLGSAQMNWLKEELGKSTAVFKIIVHGGTIRRAGKESWFETSPKEEKELLKYIQDNKLTGILFNGGDVHQNWYNPWPRCGSRDSYQAFEIVSSGWTYNSEYVHFDVDTKSATPSMTYYFHKNSGVPQSGVFTLESDGKMKHQFIIDDPEIVNCDTGSDPNPAYAFPTAY